MKQAVNNYGKQRQNRSALNEQKRDFTSQVASRAAVIVVDMQNDFCHPEGSLAKKGANLSMVDEMLPSMKGLLDSAYTFQVPVLLVQTIHETWTDSRTWTYRLNGESADVCRKDTWGADFFGVFPRQEDPVIIKHRYSAFIHTRLDTVLRTLGIRTLLMTGVSTNVCVESTARDGFMLDYDVVFLSDATAAYSRSAHEMTLKNISGYFGSVSNTAEVVNVWNHREQ